MKILSISIHLPILLLVVMPVTAAARAHDDNELLELAGAERGDRYGYAVALVGDVDGDGLNDVLIGAPSAHETAGLAEIRSGRNGSVIYSLPGPQVGAFFGWSVCGVGDVDRDGRDDFAVSAPGNPDSGATYKGRVTVYSGATGTRLVTLMDPATSYFGYAIAGAGDVNNDGFPDLVVGAPLASSIGYQSGEAHLYSGRDWSRLASLEADSGGDQFGYSVAGVGDVNRNGYDDVIVGATYDHKSGYLSGSVWVFDGCVTSGVCSQSEALIYNFNGENAGDLFGWSVAGAGDVDRDGYPDFIVGVYEDDTPNGMDSGSAVVFSGKSGAVLYHFLGEAPGDELGCSVAGAGDVNNDGYADVIVGAPEDSTSGDESGSATVFSGADGSRLFVIHGEHPDLRLGDAVAGGVGINSDPNADFIVGVPGEADAGIRGSVRVYSGGCGAVQSYGSGCPGPSGLVPVLDVSGCPTPAGSIRLNVKKAFGGGTALILLGLTQTQVGLPNGCDLLVGDLLPFSLSVSLNGIGSGALQVRLPADAPLGLVVRAQAFVNEDGAPRSFSVTNGVQIAIE
jgi:hypothetical protein